MYEAQRALVNAQAHVFVVASRACPQCGAALSIKAKHTIRYRTVFGKVSIDSPQLRVCNCAQHRSTKSFSPLALAVPLRVSPELEGRASPLPWIPLGCAVALRAKKKNRPKSRICTD